MAKIFYSMAGEGRGHAARVRSIVELLRDEHELVLFAPDQAYEFLAPRYPAGTANVEVRRIPGLRFHYTSNRLNLSRTVLRGLGYLWKLPALVEQLKQAIRAEEPDLAITDFEPALPRAARACGVPFLSLNHQHFLVACDLRSLPWSLQRYADLMGLAVQAHHWGQKETIVSSFFQAPLRRGYHDVKQVGPLLRPEIRRAVVSSGDFLVSYLRPNTPDRVIEILSKSTRQVRAYGLGRLPERGSIRFCELSEQGFVNDLAQCAAVVGAAGNQTLGESLYLGKPVLALPESQHHEQLINSHFLEQMKAGHFVPVEEFEPRHLDRFVTALDDLRGPLLGDCMVHDGNSAAVATIRGHLPRSSKLRSSTPPRRELVAS
ncbi:hypothetical protein ETAA8_10540 [Anatilimnocola aggregata]|uniref:Glycosyltransferase n=1 Tax=Anatilimnocola aggregata TaxID=2528021 RepID=A0A517Y775_9BACT|nr:glycosyltransferase family protein [Anatilimnocola aggregata]QDU25982.1 hypothetical protein ETAA8_10540 [Anatilimnocola aggregata]